MGKARRSRGSGTLEKRHGVYLARWTVDGRRFTRSLGTGDRREAEKRLAEVTAPFRLGDESERLKAIQARIGGVEEKIRAIREKAPGVLISEAWEAYEAAPERPDTCGEKALLDYRARWGEFASMMAERFPEVRELRHVGRPHVVEWVKLAERGRSNKTFNIMVRLMRAVWRVLAENPDNRLDQGRTPFDFIKRRKEITQGRRELTGEELVKVLASVKGEMRTLFLIGMYTGLRLADAASLKWSSVDLVTGRVRLLPRKTARYGREVTVPLHPRLFEELARTPPEERTGYVMKDLGSTYDRGGGHARNIASAVVRVFRKCGLETKTPAKDGGRARTLVGFHSLRHTFVSMEAEIGAPAFMVQRMVGHSSVEMTSRYYHASDDRMRAAVAALPDFTQKDAGGCADAPSGILGAFRAMVDGMGEEDRRKALEYLSEKVRGEVIEAEAVTVGVEHGTDVLTREVVVKSDDRNRVDPT